MPVVCAQSRPSTHTHAVYISHTQDLPPKRILADTSDEEAFLPDDSMNLDEEEIIDYKPYVQDMYRKNKGYPGSIPGSAENPNTPPTEVIVPPERAERMANAEKDLTKMHDEYTLYDDPIQGEDGLSFDYQEGENKSSLENSKSKVETHGKDTESFNQMRGVLKDGGNKSNVDFSDQNLGPGRIFEIAAGRSAVIGLVAAIVSELVTQQAVLSQLWGRYEGNQLVESPLHQASTAALGVLIACAIVTVVERVVGGAAPPTAPFFRLQPWTQIWLGRLSMLLLVGLLAYETLHSNRPALGSLFYLWS